MGNNANKIVLGIVVALVALMLVFVMGSGSCSSGGGGGGGGAPAALTSSSASSASIGAGSSSSSTSSSSNAEDVLDDGGYDYNPVSGADKDMTIDEFEALLDSKSAPAGENARNAAASQSVPSVAQVYQELAQRGFNDARVSVDFDINGAYSDPIVIEEPSDDKYPSYTTVYSSLTGVSWIIYVNDGSFFAAPLGSSSSPLSNNVILSESDRVVQYDGQKNEFSDFALDAVSDTTCVRVPRIDAATLDGYALETLEAM